MKCVRLNNIFENLNDLQRLKTLILNVYKLPTYVNVFSLFSVTMETEIKGGVCLALAGLPRLSIGATAMPRPPETITKETTVHPKETIILKTSVSFTLS